MMSTTATTETTAETTTTTALSKTKKIKEPDNKKGRNKHYENSYNGFCYIPIESTGRPGTPHRFFESSYTVSYDCNNDDNIGGKDSKNNINDNKHMIVHRHANGLVIVTAGNYLTNFSDTKMEQEDDKCKTLANSDNAISDTVVDSTDSTTSVASHPQPQQQQQQQIIISDIEYHVQTPSDATQESSSKHGGGGLSANAKRKLQANMLSGKKIHNNKNNNKQHQQPKKSEVQDKNHNNTKVSIANNVNHKNWIVQPKDNLVSIKLSQQQQLQQKVDIQECNKNNVMVDDESKIITLPCCVWGTIVEINPKLLVLSDNDIVISQTSHSTMTTATIEQQQQQQNEVVVDKNESLSLLAASNKAIVQTIDNITRKEQIYSILQTDPLLSGYLAIIQPTGPFPPTHDIQ